jgi:GT2 family glycosyltransferase
LIPGIPENVIAGSKIYRKEGNNNILWSCGGIFNPRTGAKYMFGFSREDGEAFNHPVEADWLPGMGTLVPVEVVKTIGYWDEKVFPQYHGDSDFTYRAKLAGFKNIVYPGLRIWNDTTNTGLKHRGSFRVLVKLLTDIKSHYNFRKNIIFYRKYSKGPLAYGALFRAYFMLFGGFFKWSFLSLFGIKKN